MTPSPGNSTITVLRRPTPLTEARRHPHEIPDYLLDRHNNDAPQALNPDIGKQNVITGSRRSRAPPVDYKSLSGRGGRGRGAGNRGVSSNFFTYYGTFATALHPTLHQKITSIVPKTSVTVYGVRTSHVPRGGEMVLLLLLMSTFYTYHDHRYVM